MAWRNGRAWCDMKETCARPVARIDDHGFVYCRECGERRDRRCRLMVAEEVRGANAGFMLKSYYRRPGESNVSPERVGAYLDANPTP